VFEPSSSLEFCTESYSKRFLPGRLKKNGAAMDHNSMVCYRSHHPWD